MQQQQRHSENAIQKRTENIIPSMDIDDSSSGSIVGAVHCTNNRTT